MKTIAPPLFKKAFLMLGMFCVSAFVAFWTTGNPGMFFKSTPYAEIDVESDTKLSALTNGKGAAILDDIIIKVKAKAEAAAGDPRNDTAYNAYLDTYLETVDLLDDQVRDSMGSDYEVIFKYLYPRVYALRAEDDMFASIFKRLGGEDDGMTRSCPSFAPPSPDFCSGGTIVPSKSDVNGCTPPPSCVPKTASTSTGTATGTVTPPSAEVDLCAEQGLTNIDETNWESMRASHIVKSGNFNTSYKDDRNYQYLMWPNESYSFPYVYNSDIKTYPFLTVVSGNPYLHGYYHVINISDKKCDFIPNPKNLGCFRVNWIGEDSITGAFSDKFAADPNYAMPGSIEGYHCKLVPGKKYYINYRWVRKSDIVDVNGNLRDTILGTNTADLFRSDNSGWLGYFMGGVKQTNELTKSKLNAFLDENFNLQGSACLGGAVGGGGWDSCLITPNFWGVGYLTKFSASEWADIQAHRSVSSGGTCEVGPCH